MNRFCSLAIDAELTRKAEQGHAPSQLNKAYLYWTKEPSDLEAVHLWLTKAADAGLAEAQSRLGQFLLSEDWSDHCMDLEAVTQQQADRYLTLAANQGDISAAATLAVLLQETDSQKALKWLHVAADGGHSFSRYRLAVLLSEEQQYDRAFHLLTSVVTSADNSTFAPEQWRTAPGCGSSDYVDQAGASDEWRRNQAPEANEEHLRVLFGEVYHLLALFFEKGLGGAALSMEQSLKCCELAIVHGHATAMWMLAVHHRNGVEGLIDVDAAAAKAWARLAAASGSEEALELFKQAAVDGEYEIESYLKQHVYDAAGAGNEEATKLLQLYNSQQQQQVAAQMEARGLPNQQHVGESDSFDDEDNDEDHDEDCKDNRATENEAEMFEDSDGIAGREDEIEHPSEIGPDGSKQDYSDAQIEREMENFANLSNKDLHKFLS